MAFGTVLHDSSIIPEITTNKKLENELKNTDEFIVLLSEKFDLNCGKAYDDAVEKVIKTGGAFARVSLDESLGGQYSKAITRCSL